MATKPKAPAKKTAAKKAPAKAPAEDLEEEVELEETDEVTEEATTEKKTKTPAVTFGAADLAALANERFNPAKPYDTRSIRTLIRKMAREENPRVQREVIAGNRTRYDWSGPEDPEVIEILNAIGGGEIEQAKAESLATLKENTKVKKDKKKKDKAAKEAKSKGEPVADSDEEEIDLDD